MRKTDSFGSHRLPLPVYIIKKKDLVESSQLNQLDDKLANRLMTHNLYRGESASFESSMSAFCKIVNLV